MSTYGQPGEEQRGPVLFAFVAMGSWAVFANCTRPMPADLVAGACLWWITPFTPAQSALIALVITILGFFGGLVMSAIKRDRGVKDWGTMIEGHGGVLDRLDSVCFSAPIFFHVVRYWWTP